MRKITLIILGVVVLAGAVFLFINKNNDNKNKDIMTRETKTQESYSKNINEGGKMLLVLSAPSIHDEYYEKAFQEIVDFQISYLNKILENDNAVIIVDEDTKKYYERKIPEQNILIADVHDIWMRDFTTVDPINPVEFVYTWASMSKYESQDVQKSFVDAITNKLGVEREKSNLILDGGNIVDNYKGRIVTTARFLEDNKLSREEGKRALKEFLGAKEVAILEPDEDGLAHSDGMVAFIDDNTLLVNDYSEDKEFRDIVLDELEASFPGVKIIEVPVKFKESEGTEWEGFSSSCGVNLNLVMTNNALYVPTFGIENDKEVLKIIRANTSKAVVEVPATSVCPMGGSVRCLTWQVMGENARKIIEAAQVK